MSDNADKKVLPFVNTAHGMPDSRTGQIAETIERDVCPFCFGTGTKLDRENGRASLCDCRRSNTATRLLELARIPPRYHRCDFHNYYPKNDSQYFAHSFAFRLVEEYPAVETGLLFTGTVGVGKTHLSSAILKGLIEKGFGCLFYEFGSLLKAIQDSYNPISQTSEMRVLAPVFQAEVLVLDELGATVPTDWVRDTMYQVINTRYNNKKLTIFTTSYLDELNNQDQIENLESRRIELRRRGYSQENTDEEKRIDKKLAVLRGAKTLEDRIGPSLRSRIYEMCTKVPIEGTDYRRLVNQRRFESPQS
jgi:DNA replication protein DnaC